MGGLLAALIASAAMAQSAQAARGLHLGFSDPLFQSDSRGAWLDRSASVGASQAKLFVGWRGVAPTKPANPRDPADPAYSFAGLDASVRAARARGLRVLIGVQGAPAWAEGKNRSSGVPAGTWKPDPKATGDFMAALARRYSGSYPDPKGGTLPRVRDYQLWNEPNLSTYLTPQWKGGRAVAVTHYKRMLNAAYKGVHSAQGGARLVTAGLAPYGDEPGGARTRPLQFWRKAFCLKKRRLKPKKRCPSKARFDVFAHHAINTSGPPRQGALDRDDASSGDLRDVRRTLRAAERGRTVKGKRRHPLWATEMWWESDPPSDRGYPPRKQARFIQETLYLAWKARFSSVIQLRIRDSEPTTSNGTRFGDGLYFLDGRPKPSVGAFKFPFIAESRGGRKLTLWGKAPAKGRVVVQRKKRRRWKRVTTLRAGGSHVFTGKTRLRGRVKLRAKQARQKSLPWRVR